MNDITHITKLPHAPLQEVVFEARWEPEGQAQSTPHHDAGFELAQGRFADRLEGNFNYQRRLVPEPVASFLVGQIVHQFWTAEGMFPLVQYGPCIMTVNTDGKGYEWERKDGTGYRDLIRQTLLHLQASYKGKLRLTEVKLFYIDAIDLPDTTDAFDRLKKLKIDLRFGASTLPGPFSARVDFGHALDHDSILQIAVQDATSNITGNPALMWQIAVHRRNCAVWADQENLVEAVIEWCEYARSITSPLFKEMTRGQLYESFL